MATKRQIKAVARKPQSPRHKSAVERREANSPENRAIRAATKIHKEGSFRWR